jgi:hypothetical protein
MARSEKELARSFVAGCLERYSEMEPAELQRVLIDSFKLTRDEVYDTFLSAGVRMTAPEWQQLKDWVHCEQAPLIYRRHSFSL